jgi:hypothetical protein
VPLRLKKLSKVRTGGGAFVGEGRDFLVLRIECEGDSRLLFNEPTVSKIRCKNEKLDSW